MVYNGLKYKNIYIDESAIIDELLTSYNIKTTLDSPSNLRFMSWSEMAVQQYISFKLGQIKEPKEE